MEIFRQFSYSWDVLLSCSKLLFLPLDLENNFPPWFISSSFHVMGFFDKVSFSSSSLPWSFPDLTVLVLLHIKWHFVSFNFHFTLHSSFHKRPWDLRPLGSLILNSIGLSPMNPVSCVHEIMLSDSPSCTAGPWFLRWVHTFALSFISSPLILQASNPVKRGENGWLVLCWSLVILLSFRGVIWKLKSFVMLEAKHTTAGSSRDHWEGPLQMLSTENPAGPSCSSKLPAVRTLVRASPDSIPSQERDPVVLQERRIPNFSVR